MALSVATAFPTVTDTIVPEITDVQLVEGYIHEASRIPTAGRPNHGFSMGSEPIWDRERTPQSTPKRTSDEVEADEPASDFIEQMDQFLEDENLSGSGAGCHCFASSVHCSLSGSQNQASAPALALALAMLLQKPQQQQQHRK